MNIVALLKEKNNHLEKFYRLNESAQMLFEKDNFDDLENFYNSREGILTMILKIDDMIERSNQSIDESYELSSQGKQEVIDELNYKNELVNRILAQDLQILSIIEQAKSDIIKELSQLRASRKAVGSYKSGSQFKVLDEEI